MISQIDYRFREAVYNALMCGMLSRGIYRTNMHEEVHKTQQFLSKWDYEDQLDLLEGQVFEAGHFKCAVMFGCNKKTNQYQAFIIMEGTNEWDDWIKANLNPVIKNVPHTAFINPAKARAGFLDVLHQPLTAKRNILCPDATGCKINNLAVVEVSTIPDEIRKYLNFLNHKYQHDDPIDLSFTGHSMGACVQVLAHQLMRHHLDQNDFNLHSLMTFGAPLVGNRQFRDELRAINPEAMVLHFAHNSDLVAEAGWYCNLIYSPLTALRIFNGRLEDFNLMQPRDGLVDLVAQGSTSNPHCSYIAQIGQEKWARRVDVGWRIADNMVFNTNEYVRKLQIPPLRTVLDHSMQCFIDALLGVEEIYDFKRNVFYHVDDLGVEKTIKNEMRDIHRAMYLQIDPAIAHMRC